MAATGNTTSAFNTQAEAPRHAHRASITRAELLQYFRDGKKAGKDFILIDLRRKDYEGGIVKGSLNLPEQSLYPSIPTLYAVLSAAKIKQVIWYCGSYRGRGSRAAAWFDDYIRDQKDYCMKSLTLVDGIKGGTDAGE